MKDIWKYSTYGERDRLKLIRKGFEDVYETEKERNKSLRKAREELNLPTYDIDDWDKKLDAAQETWIKNSTPRYTTRFSSVNKAFKEASDLINQERKKALNNAEEEAENAYKMLSEWLINNGFSDEGYTSKTSKKELEENYKKLIDTIKKEYKSLREETRRSYFSPYLG